MVTSSMSMVKQVYIDQNPCAVFKKRLTLQWPSLFSCCLFLLVDTEVIICHWWCTMESKWLKNPLYGYQQCVKLSTCLHWSKSMCCLQNEAHAVMATTIFLLHAHSGHWGHHLSLMMYGVKISEDTHVWLPAVCQMVKQVYIDHNPCAVFKKRLTLWCPPLFSCCLFLVAMVRPLCVTGDI
jgi:hypothetical protein